MQKNRKILLHFLAIILVLLGGILPSSKSFAYITPTTQPVAIESEVVEQRTVYHICPNNDPKFADKDAGLTIRLIPCIRDTITFAISSVLQPFSEFLSDTIRITFVLAVAIWGILLLAGNPIHVSQNGLTLALKIGAVIIFTDNFGGMYPVLLDALEEMLNILAAPVTNPAGSTGITVWRDTGCVIGNFQASEQNIMTVWNILDCYIELFIGGIFSSSFITATVYKGIIGFVVGMLFSGTVGTFIALLGFYMIATAIFTIARTVYIFITAYVAFSFVVFISPLFIPCILFATTKDLFDGWLRLLITFLIQPIFLFGYLIMFLVALNITIFNGHHSLYYAIAGKESEKTDFKIGDWLGSNNIYTAKLIGDDKVAVDIGGAQAAVQAKVANTTTHLGFTPSDNETEVGDTLGNRPSSEKVPFSYGLGLDPLHYFETGVEVKAVDWEMLAQKGDPDGWNKVKGGTDEQKDEFYKNYMIRVFLGFLMTAIVIYVFYSLLEYIPYVGTASLGHAGMPVLGTGSIGMPGSRYFGVGR